MDPDSSGYLRLPSISADTVVFVTEDDLWSVPAAGGDARRLTADLLAIGRPALSPGGDLVAFTSEVQGQPEVYVMPTAGGAARRLTWQGRPAHVLAWMPDGRVVFSSPSGQPFSSLTMAHAIDPAGEEPSSPLPFGPVGDVSYGPSGGVVVGRNTADPAQWKRYRGGTAGFIWIDREGDGEFELLLRPDVVGGNLASPMWVGDRIYFLSDHEGIGNLYSCSLSGEGISRHTDHDEYYARFAATDGSRVVYQVAAEIWLFDPAAESTARLEVSLGSPRTQRQPRFVDAGHEIESYALDKTGERLLVDARGKVFDLAPWDGPVRQHGEGQGVRYRLPTFLGDGAGVAAISDASGAEAIEILRSPAAGDGEATSRVLDIPRLGRVFELVPSPDGKRLGVTNHEHQLLLVDVESGTSQLLDESDFGRISDLDWSGDGRWLAYSFPASRKTANIKIADADDGATYEVTRAEFRDSKPAFDPTGKYLYFLSRRTFDPVYDSLFFDLGFPKGVRPYLITLQADLPSPFLVKPQPKTAPDASRAGEPPAGAEEAGAPPAVVVEFDGVVERVVEVPVAEARYEDLVALENKILLVSRPIEGVLGQKWTDWGPKANATVQSYDLVEGRCETQLADVLDIALSGDRSKLAYLTGSPGERRLRIVPAAAKPDAEHEGDPPGRASGWVDLGRIRIKIDPGAEWSQMVREAWRLQSEQFWTADLSGVDWRRVLDRYLPLVDRVATRAELSDVIWELQGELGTSHCYEFGGDYRKAPEWGQGHLGADLERDSSGRWVVSELVQGSSWDDKEASPLLTPGARVAAGTAVLAVNGQPVEAGTGPAPLLANQAGQPVELTVSGADGGGERTIVVPTLADERPLRYRAWVRSNRDRVREATGGRGGYLHIPDMMGPGWSEFHRSFMAEIERDALLVDARFNGGGHVSGLVLEKLARRRLGWDLPRRGASVSYPEDAPVGPLVLLTNELAGSDGDIFTHGWKLLGLGPVVGTRTWGGVIGIEPTQLLVDGSLTTQAEYAFWFEDVGFGVENYGSDPGEEVMIRPQDYAAGHDPQLERAIELIVEALQDHKPAMPDRDRLPSKALPVLPPR